MLKIHNFEVIINLLNEGLIFIPGFFTSSEIENLRKELDFMFSRNIINGPGFSVCLSKYVQEITWPVSKLKSVNLLEKALSILNIIDEYPDLKDKKFQLAHVAVYREIGNPIPLHWHSDGRNQNLIRAQVCIRGGQHDSGAFQYIKKSNLLKDLKYLPPIGYVESNRDNIVTCAEPNGTLYLFDTYGIHNKTICTSERISIMFDFLPEDYIINHPSDVSSNLVISIDNLTERVVNSLFRFKLNKPLDSNPSPNTIDNYKYNLKLGGLTRKFTFLSKLKKIFLLNSREQQSNYK